MTERLLVAEGAIHAVRLKQKSKTKRKKLPKEMMVAFE